jgi:hypothetical protein
MELLQLLPPETCSAQRIELCIICWARVTDRREQWPELLRSLPPAELLPLCQRLGWNQMFSPASPALHYTLRMYKWVAASWPSQVQSASDLPS